MRTRLTHALEVAQVATGVARAVGLNVALTERSPWVTTSDTVPAGTPAKRRSIPSSRAASTTRSGARRLPLDLNLCAETLDGIRTILSRPAPSTPEGEVVSWADRIAYVCHDFEDAVSAGMSSRRTARLVADRCGVRAANIGAFINAMIATIRSTGVIGMDASHAEALAAFRRFN